MIIKALHPNIKGNPRTNLTEEALKNQNELTTQNSIDFHVNDFIVIGNPKEGQTEIRRIANVNGKRFTLDANLLNTHPQNTKITKIKYNQVKFYRASSKNGTYTEVSTKDIAIDEPHTLLDFTAALPTDFFKIRYYNSITSGLSVMSDPIGTEGFSRYTLRRIQDALFKRTGDEREQYFDRDMITDWVNEIKDEMSNIIIDTNEKYFDTFTDYGVNAEGEAELDDAFRKFQKVFVLYNGDRGVRARRLEIEDINDWQQSFSRSAPCYYFKAYNIGIRPKGEAGKTIVRIYSEQQPRDLEHDADELPKPIRFYLHIVMDGLMAKASEKNGKDGRAERYEKKYRRGLEQMTEEINNLVLDENRSIND